MSENNSENFETINDIKNKKKQISEKAKLSRQNNIKKALEQKKKNKEQRSNKKDLEKKIKTIFNSEDEEEDKKNILELDKLKEVKNIKIEENDDYKNNLKNMMLQIDNINKRVEKLYLIKKNKKYNNNNLKEEIKKDNKKDIDLNIEKQKMDLLQMMKMKMYNQY